MTLYERIAKLEREAKDVKKKICCISGGGGSSLRFGFSGEDDTADSDRQFAVGNHVFNFIADDGGVQNSSLQIGNNYVSMSASDNDANTNSTVSVTPTQLTIAVVDIPLVFTGLNTDDTAMQVLAIDGSGNTVIKNLPTAPDFAPDFIKHTEDNSFDSFIGTNNVVIPNGSSQTYSGVTAHVVHCESCGYSFTQEYVFFNLSNNYGVSPGHFILGTHRVLGDNTTIDFDVVTSTLAMSNITLGGAMITQALRAAGLSPFADNAAALGGGLVAGDFYISGDFVKVVH